MSIRRGAARAPAAGRRGVPCSGGCSRPWRSRLQRPSALRGSVRYRFDEFASGSRKRHARTFVIESKLADLPVGDSVRGEVVRIGGVEVVAGEQFKHESPESGLERWARYRRMRAVHTAVAGLGPQNRSAATASVERAAEFRGHRRRLGSTALGAGNRRIEDQQVFQRCHREAAIQLGVPSHRRPAPPGNPSDREWPASPAGKARMTSIADITTCTSSPSLVPAPKWSRAIANVTRYERVPACSPTGAAKPLPIQALVFSG